MISVLRDKLSNNMNISQIKKKIKKNRTVFFTYRKLADRDYKSNYRDYLKGENNKTKEMVKKELAMIRDFWKCEPMHYYRYRLYEKNLSYEELIDYVPAYYFYNYHMPSVIDDLNYKITESKIMLSEYFAVRNFETPVTVAMIKRGRILGITGTEMTFDELTAAFLESSSGKFFIKPDKGRGGKGIFTIKKINSKLLLNDWPLGGKIFDEKTSHKDFIIQEGLKQRSDIGAINPSSVNTLRIVTQYSGTDYRISAAVLRIGRNGSDIDNATQGGISVNIDTESGIFSKYAFTEHTTEIFEKHPDTNFKFEGSVIDNWGKVKQKILDYAVRATEFPEVAWDIAILEKGIAVIEINLNYGIDHLQCCIGGMRRKLNISPLY